MYKIYVHVFIYIYVHVFSVMHVVRLHMAFPELPHEHGICFHEDIKSL